MSATFYLVTDGDYSDYHVLGIYSTPELAAHAKAVHAAENDVEEYVLDYLPETPPGLLAFSVMMDIKGDCHEKWGGEQIKRETCVGFKPRTCPYGDAQHMSFNVWASDATHAIKIANEQRAQLIALGQWEVNWDVWKKAHP